MAKHISGWNLFMGERMKAIHDLKQVALLWKNLSEQERLVWNQQALMINLFESLKGLETAVERKKRPLHAYNYFVREQSKALKHIKDPKIRMKTIGSLWRELAPVQKEAWGAK
jgi:hypothetical protein